MITAANRGQIESISEIALNLLKSNILIPKSSFKRLKPYKDKLLYLTRKKPSLKQKKEVLNQKGGFLPALAGLVAPLAVDLLGKLFKWNMYKRCWFQSIYFKVLKQNTD